MPWSLMVLVYQSKHRLRVVSFALGYSKSVEVILLHLVSSSHTFFISNNFKS